MLRATVLTEVTHLVEKSSQKLKKYSCPDHGHALTKAIIRGGFDQLRRDSWWHDLFIYACRNPLVIVMRQRGSIRSLILLALYRWTTQYDVNSFVVQPVS